MNCRQQPWQFMKSGESPANTSASEENWNKSEHMPLDQYRAMEAGVSWTLYM
jgi:hypothetical protein